MWLELQVDEKGDSVPVEKTTRENEQHTRDKDRLEGALLLLLLLKLRPVMLNLDLLDRLLDEALLLLVLGPPYVLRFVLFSVVASIAGVVSLVHSTRQVP